MIAITQNLFYVVFEGAQNNLIFFPKICMLVLCNHDILTFTKLVLCLQKKAPHVVFCLVMDHFQSAVLLVQPSRCLQEVSQRDSCRTNCCICFVRWPLELSAVCAQVRGLHTCGNSILFALHLVCRLLQQHICHAHTLPHQTPHTHTHTTFFMVYAVNLKCTNYVPSLIIFLSVLAEKLLKNKLIPNILPQVWQTVWQPLSVTAEFLFSQLSVLFCIKCVELWAKTGFLFDDGLLPSTLELSPMICSLTLHWLLTFFSLFFLIFFFRITFSPSSVRRSR